MSNIQDIHENVHNGNTVYTLMLVLFHQ